MKKSGFTLLELIIVIAFSSVISMTLFMGFFQINRGVVLLDQNADFDRRFALFSNQLEKDLSSIFVPSSSLVAYKKFQNQKDKKDEKINVIDKGFYSVNKQNSLSMLTFLSNNILATYDKQTSGKIYLSRIVYSLESQSIDATTHYFTVKRQQSTELDLESYQSTKKNIKAYSIITDVKSLTIEYQFTLPDSKDKNKSSWQTVSDWNFSLAQLAEKKYPFFPALLSVNLVLWDASHHYERSYSMHYLITTFGYYSRLIKPSEGS